MKKVMKPRQDEDEDFDPGSEGVLGYTVQTRMSHNFSVHINQAIQSPDYYSKIFDMCLNASEQDMITFWICSPGGRLDGLGILLEGIRMTDAHTVAVVVGEASSAASILMLHCNEVVITESAEATIHACRFGTGGKVADVVGFVKHTSKVTEKLARSTYEGFLSENEMKQMLDGTEFFFDADELRERLDRRMEYLEEKHKKEQEAQQPKKPARRKKVLTK